MIPVTVLTGFLGSGKTTLLGKLLRRPEFARTAVIVNEFGEVGLDHELIAASEEMVVELETGCLCCAVRDDLALTLSDLLARRDRGDVQLFERIVIETSGLADPAPILQLLMTDRPLAGRLALAGVVTTIDAVHGLATLEREALSVKQAAVADRLVLTKTDLAGGVPEALAGALRQINPAAPRIVAIHGDAGESALISGLPDPGSEPLRWLAIPPELQGASDAPLHGAAESYAVVRDSALPAVALTLFLEALAEHCGRDLLRMKGIIAIAESPERPAVIHGVQHVFHPPAFLDRWPSTDRRSRLVFIVRGIPRGWIVALLDAIANEVADVSRQLK